MTLRGCPSAISGSIWASALCVALVVLAPAPAQAMVLEVQGIQVDITAESAAEAREQAILEAQRRAFEQLVGNLTGGGTAPQLSDAEITALVRDFSITNEKSSSVRYIGTFDFRFNRAGVSKVLGRTAAPSTAASGPVVIVPVYQSDAGQTLWDEPNPWREAWAKHASARHVVPTLVPLGDLEDVAAIGPEDAIAGDMSRLMGLARQYGAESALVALAVIDFDESSPSGPLLTVTTQRYSHEGQTSPLRETFEAMPGESIEDVLDRAAATAHADLQTRWRQETMAATTEPAVIGVAVPIKGLSDWLSVRNRLQNQRMVRTVDLVTLTREEARVNLITSARSPNLPQRCSRTGSTLCRMARSGHCCRRMPGARTDGAGSVERLKQP
jgi:head-tail adaptor